MTNEQIRLLENRLLNIVNSDDKSVTASENGLQAVLEAAKILIELEKVNRS